mmetsp:Transcript_39972/g.106967  ORF Transcript_39972/g.106967 Transcript_39972/m.106967 type:complete len:173 (+) Transcript_39972:762-1280(+)
MENVLHAGKKNRSVGATLMNQDSSRSHSIFSVIIESSSDATPAAGGKAASGEKKFRAGKLNLVDLAGSERQGKTGATGERLKEATKINLSLSALGGEPPHLTPPPPPPAPPGAGRSPSFLPPAPLSIERFSFHGRPTTLPPPPQVKQHFSLSLLVISDRRFHAHTRTLSPKH